MEWTWLFDREESGHMASVRAGHPKLVQDCGRVVIENV